MRQPPIRRCSKCGTEASADQRFCSNCGAVVDQDMAKPTAPASEQDFAQHPGISMPPPPPDVDQYATFRQQSNYTPPPPNPNPPSYHQQSTEGSFTPPYQNSTLGQSVPGPGYPGPGYPVPPYAQAPRKDNTGKILGRIGCGAGLLILLALLVCGGVSYGLYTVLSKSVSKSISTAGSTYNTGTTSNAVPTPSPIKTAPLNLNFKYSNITYTIVDTKQSATFSDDPSTNKPGVVRVDFKEANNTNNSISFAYNEMARMILPDQTSVPPQNEKAGTPPANGANQDNWLDFPVPLGTATDKLVLRLGSAQEAQMDIPLTPQANLTKYQDVTVKPNGVTTYGGLKWTLTSATLSWSAYDKQADSGKRYVTIGVTIDNPTTADKSSYWGSYLRLKAGTFTSAPDTNATIPTSFAAGSTGTTGIANFQVPQDSTTFTLIFLADQIETGAPQESIDFHIP